MGTRGGETQDTENTGLTVLPPSRDQPSGLSGTSRTVHHPTGRGGGRSGGLTGHGDRTGQKASRAVPVLGAMAGQGTREAMAERGAWVAMVDPRTQEAMAERGAWAPETERTAWAPGPERNAWAPGPERTLARSLWRPLWFLGPPGWSSLESTGEEQALGGAGEEPALEGARGRSGSSLKLEVASGDEGELGGTSGDEDELDGTSGDEDELDGTSGDEDELGGASGEEDELDGTSGDEGELGGASGEEDELDGTSGDEGELDGTSRDKDKLGGASRDTRGLVSTRDRKLPTIPRCLGDPWGDGSRPRAETDGGWPHRGALIQLASPQNSAEYCMNGRSRRLRARTPAANSIASEEELFGSSLLSRCTGVGWGGSQEHGTKRRGTSYKHFNCNTEQRSLETGTHTQVMTLRLDKDTGRTEDLKRAGNEGANKIFTDTGLGTN